MINLLGTFTPKFEIYVPLLTFPVFASQELQAKEIPDANREALNALPHDANGEAAAKVESVVESSQTFVHVS